MGVCYPHSIGAEGDRQPKHAAIFDAISHEADFDASHPELGPSSKLVEQTANEIDAAPGIFGVLSAEGLSGERQVFADALAPLADRFDVTVVMFVRRQDHWVESFYKQMVLSRQVKESRPFHEFVADASTQKHMNYLRIAGWWRDKFEDLRIIGFRPDQQKSPLSRLLDVAGLGRRYRWLPFSHSHENRSPGAEAVEVVRRLNEKGIEAPRNAASLIEAKCGESDGRFFTHDERQALLKKFESGNQKLLERLSPADHSCLAPNMTELGRSRETHWRGQVSAKFLRKSLDAIHLTL